MHHGGCSGGDRMCHELCRDVFGHGIHIIIHPMLNPPAGCQDLSDADEVKTARASSARNENIVRACMGGVLLACPAAAELDPASRHSGTWQTVRIGRRLGVEAVIFAK